MSRRAVPVRSQPELRGGISVIAGPAAIRNCGLSRSPKLRGLGLKIMIQPVTFQGWMNLLLSQRIAAGCVGS
jgi:hypothetical protein